MRGTGRSSRSLWAAQRLGKTSQAGEVYARDVVAIDFASPMPGVVLERVAADSRPGPSGSLGTQLPLLSNWRWREGPEAMLATEVMRSSFATVKPTTPLIDAARLLLETNQRSASCSG